MRSARVKLIIYCQLNSMKIIRQNEKLNALQYKPCDFMNVWLWTYDTEGMWCVEQRKSVDFSIVTIGFVQTARISACTKLITFDSFEMSYRHPNVCARLRNWTISKERFYWLASFTTAKRKSYFYFILLVRRTREEMWGKKTYKS